MLFGKKKEKEVVNPLEMKIQVDKDGKHFNTLAEAFNITNERFDDLIDMVNMVVAKARRNHGVRGRQYNDVILGEISKRVNTISELGIACYIFGALNGIDEAKSRNKDHLGRMIGGLLGGAIIMGKGGAGFKPEEDEDPVQKLIRESYEMNKGKKKGKSEEGGE